MDTREKYITKDTREIKEQSTLEIMEKEDEILLAVSQNTRAVWRSLFDMLLSIKVDIENIKAGNKWNGHFWEGETKDITKEV